MVHKVNTMFWKKEKMLAFFESLSLCLVVLSVFCISDKKSVFLPYYWFSGQEYGILAFSIFLGFLFLWLYGIKEREKDYVILKMLGITQIKLQKELHLELLKFQITTIFPAVLYAVFFLIIGEEIQIFAVMKSFFRIHLDLHLLFGVIGFIRLSRIKITASEPLI